MKTKRLFRLFAAALAAAGFLSLPAVADSRLAGYWTSAPGEADQAVFSFSLLGKWTIVTQHWAGGDRPAPDLKVRYTVATEGNKGTLTADEKLEDKPGAPRAIGYEIDGAALVLTFEGPAHAGKYHFTKSAPPAAAPTPLAVAPPRPVAPRPSTGVLPPPPAPMGVEMLFGDWRTPPNAPVQVTLVLSKSKTAEVRIAQQWIAGDQNAVSKNSDYIVAADGRRGTLTKIKPDYDGSVLPLKLVYGLEGDTLVISVDGGPFGGQHRLGRTARR